MTLRRAVEEDVEVLVALEQQLFGTDAWSAASVRDEVLAGRVVVAADPDVRGYVVTRPAGDAVDLMRIGVAPSSRRRGLARALLGSVTSPSCQAPGGPRAAHRPGAAARRSAPRPDPLPAPPG